MLEPFTVREEQQKGGAGRAHKAGTVAVASQSRCTVARLLVVCLAGGRQQPLTPFCGSASMREFECSLCAMQLACHLLPQNDQSLFILLFSFLSTCVEPAPQPGVPGRREGHRGV